MPEYTKRQLLRHLRAINQEYEKMPTISDLREYNGREDQTFTPHPQTYVSRFGSWTAALKEAFRDPELLGELWMVAYELDRRPFKSDLEEYSRFELRAYRRRFDTWEQALQQAGFDPTVRIPLCFIIADVRRIAKMPPVNTDGPLAHHSTVKEDVYLTAEKIQKYGKYSHDTYVSRLSEFHEGRSLTAVEEVAGLFDYPWTSGHSKKRI